MITVKECLDYIYQKDILDIDTTYEHLSCVYNYVINADLVEKINRALQITMETDAEGLFLSADITTMKRLLNSQDKISVYVNDLARELTKLVIHQMYRYDDFRCLHDVQKTELVVLGILAYIVMRNCEEKDKDDMADVVLQIYQINHKGNNVEAIVNELSSIYRWHLLYKKTNICRCIKESDKSTQKIKNIYDEASKLL